VIVVNATPALGFPPHGVAAVATPALLRERGISLRHAETGDIPFLRLLYACVREEELAAVPWPHAAKQAFLDSQFSLQHLHYMSHYRDADFLLIEQHGKPIGRYYLLRDPSDFLVVDVSLERRCRGQGIATALLRLTQGEAAERGTGVQLHVQYGNEGARRLYERLGFRHADDEGTHQRLRWAPNAD
jgi:ribosomal protein S18 acetylase RimI-like enzyme